MSTEKNIEFKVGQDYLVESKHGVSKMKVIEVAKTCIKVKWDSGNTVWLKRQQFVYDFPIPAELEIIEVL